MKKRLALLLGTTLACGMSWPLTEAQDASAMGCLITRDEFVKAVSALGHGSPTTAQYDGLCANLADGLRRKP